MEDDVWKTLLQAKIREIADDTVVDGGVDKDHLFAAS